MRRLPSDGRQTEQEYTVRVHRKTAGRVIRFSGWDLGRNDHTGALDDGAPRSYLIVPYA
ncbi:hypothetical protein GCM10009827_079890 [Dactylosporangium maewongense]|uniref:Uncharacterized protein n=1 Tax=Dactylosporangium maewongense TaxID=634393 RepID=A0ABP4MNG7_9ACTN